MTDSPVADYHLEPAALARILFVAVAIPASWFGLWGFFAPFDAIALTAALVGGYPIFREAISNLAARKMTMELSMTIALVAALSIGEFFTALVIVFFVLVAEELEEVTVGRGRRAIRDLLDFLPRLATIRTAEGETQETEAASLRPGDVIVIKPGGRIPVDGEVLTGNSFVDQAAITGESLPIEKSPGSEVYAGTINQSGVLELRAARTGRDSTFGKIVEAVERAESSRAPIQKTADRLAGYLVYFAIGCAALTFLITRDARSTISVIIVAGACGIAAGTPLAILGAIGRAARMGAIIKGGAHLEALSKVDTVVLDKTGTLTFGSPEITKVSPCTGISPKAVLEAAATAERFSEHPLARAVLELAAEHSISVTEPESFDYSPGKGITCSSRGDEIIVGSRAFLTERGIDTDTIGTSQGFSKVQVARSGIHLGTLSISDVLRPEAVRAVDALREVGIRTELLTGDSPYIAEAVAKELGVDHVLADLLPEQKLERVQTLMAQGKRVAMVGDGINDAPALAESSVGVAMGSGTDVARESADIVLLGNDLLKFVDTLRLARRCDRIIMANFAGTLVVDGVGVGLAAFGFLSPLLAAFIHVASELIFILNSARLIPVPSKSSDASS